jgi:hypothetical protein
MVGLGRRMRRRLEGGRRGFGGKRVDEVVIFRRRRKSTYRCRLSVYADIKQAAARTVGVGRCLLRLEHLHVADVVDVQLRLEHHDQPLPVEAHGQDRRAEGHLADGGVPLPSVSSAHFPARDPASSTNLCVLYAQHAGRQRQGDQRGGEEHLQAGHVALARLGLLVERVGRVYAVAIASTWWRCEGGLRSGEGGDIPTPRWLWSWLNVTKFMAAMVAVAAEVPKFTRPFTSEIRLGAWARSSHGTAA